MTDTTPQGAQAQPDASSTPTPPLRPDEIQAGDAFAAASSKLWWLYLVGGIISILFGALILSFEFATIVAVAVFVGIYLIAWGIMQFIAAARRADAPKWLYIVAGIIAVIAGVLALAWPGITLFVLSIFIGWVLIIWGIFDIVGSFFITHQKWWWLYLIRGILAAVLGVWALAHPGLTLVVAVTVIGIAAVIFGVVEVIVSFQLRHLDKKWDRRKQEWGLAPRPGPSADLGAEGASEPVAAQESGDAQA